MKYLFNEWKKYLENNENIYFDVPMHGKDVFSNDLNDCINDIYKYDANSSPKLDFLHEPNGVISKSQERMAKIFNADNFFYLVNGTTVGCHAMIQYAVKNNEKIILFRNSHKSIHSGLVFSGANPVYIDGDLDIELGIIWKYDPEKIMSVIRNNLDAKAIVLTYPTYYGTVYDISMIIKLCKENNILVLVDSAHGPHLNFSDKLPEFPSTLGADIVVCSLHKTLGSLTQSSAMITSSNINRDKMLQIINMFHSTSPSYLLMVSSELAIEEMHERGDKLLQNILNTNEYFENNSNLTSFFRISEEYLENAYDKTKLLIGIKDINISGKDIYNILVEKYSIQPELAEENIILFTPNYKITNNEIDKLIFALKEIENNYKSTSKKEKISFNNNHVDNVMTPRDAWMSDHEFIEIDKSFGRICAEYITIYPPGTPLISYGEKITNEIIQNYKRIASKNFEILSHKKSYVKVVKE